MFHSSISSTAPSAQAPSRVKVVISVDRQILLLRRPTGEWDLPGGRCDAGETLEETMQRELLEEIGLAPNQARFMQSAWRPRKSKPPVHVAFFGCALDRHRLISELQLSPEHQDAQLILAETLPQLTMPPLYAQMAALWLQADQISK
jgi:8-oxo-dGTP pyrophosphatase MutT (NUDIX family)